MIFRKRRAQPSHIINLLVNLFEDIRYYDVVPSVCDHYSSASIHAYVKRRSRAEYRHLMAG